MVTNDTFGKSPDEFEEIAFVRYADDIRDFSRRHQGFLKASADLNAAADEIFLQVHLQKSQRAAVLILMLGRLCERHFESIVLLSACAQGYSAMRIVRSLFEKFVDAKYLHSFPQESSDFWDYAYVQMIREGREAQARKIEPNLMETVARFRRGKSWRLMWSRLNTVQKAEKVGIEPLLIDSAYRKANTMVHSSLDEIMGSFMIESDGTLTPSYNTVSESSVADAAVNLAVIIYCQMLAVLCEQFQIEEPHALQSFVSKFVKSFQ